MAVEIRVPALGESVTEATVGQWFKKEGEAINADEPLVELETDKVTIEVPAPATGTLSEISVNEGDTVEIGAVLGAIIEGRGAVKVEAVKATASNEIAAPVAVVSSSQMPPSPSAGKLMAESGVLADAVEGSGRRGQVLKEDVLRVIEGGASAASAPATVPAPVAPTKRVPMVQRTDGPLEERVRMTRLRQTIAKRLKDAQNSAAILTTFNEVDMSAVMDLRNEYKDLFLKKHGVKLGFMGFFRQGSLYGVARNS